MMEMNFMHPPMLEKVTPEAVNELLLEYRAQCERLDDLMGIEEANPSLCITPTAEQTMIHEGVSPQNRNKASQYLKEIQENYQEMTPLQFVHSIEKKGEVGERGIGNPLNEIIN